MKTLFTTSLLTLAMSVSGVAQAEENKAPTIRTLSGAQATTSLPAGKTALIVIDIQNEYFPGGKMPIPDAQRVLKQNQKLVNFAHQQSIPVFFVQHLGPVSGPVFAEGSRFAEFHPDLQPTQSDIVITKHTPSSFVGTNLDNQLKEKGVTQLIVSGLMTHMCVSTTARDAMPLGYSVIIPEDATATRDLENWEGEVIDHRVLQRSALTAVADVFAEISTTDTITTMKVE